MLSDKLTRRQLLSILPIVPMAVLRTNSAKVRKTAFSSRFNIGDYVEFRSQDIEDPTYYERGEIAGITLHQTGIWDYTFMICECPENDYVGQFSQAYENELTLLARANSKTELFGF